MVERYQVVVIGAGQAGLAIGYHLQQQGRRFIILEAAPEVGASWRKRWDSLRLFTPSQYDALPGLPFPGRFDTYPDKDEVAAYLRNYAKTFGLPVRLNCEVVSVKEDGVGYIVATEDASFYAEQVVIATGPFQRPLVPEFARHLSPSVVQLHSSEYRNPGGLPTGEVLVVGSGNSGVQIAQELATSRRVFLSQGRTLPAVPSRILGRSLFWWLDKLGVMKVPADSGLGQRMRGNDDVVIGESPSKLVHSDRLEVLPRAVGADGNTIRFADGRSLSVRAVVWATGYRADYSWVELPVFDDVGLPVHERGVTAANGLYFIGLRWQHTTGSALLGWVGRDAAYLADRIEECRIDLQQTGLSGSDG